MAAARRRDTQAELRARVIDDLRANLSKDFGQLRDPDGELLTEALTRFQRLSPPPSPCRGDGLSTS